MKKDIKAIALRKNESPILIQVWVFKGGSGAIRILTDKRDGYRDIKINPEAFLDFIREQTIDRS